MQTNAQALLHIGTNAYLWQIGGQPLGLDLQEMNQSAHKSQQNMVQAIPDHVSGTLLPAAAAPLHHCACPRLHHCYWHTLFADCHWHQDLAPLSLETFLLNDLLAWLEMPCTSSAS